jgi:cytidyltransferase-like protein
MQLERAVRWMRTLNKGAADVLRGLAPNAVTDVTGFGLFGHAHEMAERSGVRIRLEPERFPAIDGALDLARNGVRTSGDPRNRDFAGPHVSLDGIGETLEALAFDPQRAASSCRYRPTEARRSRRSSVRASCSSAASVRWRRVAASSLPDGRGMIHGRFQPFHNGHLEYLRGAAARSDVVFVGITNPDPWRVKEEPTDPLRHLPESNPFTYTERLLMIEAVAADERIPAHVIPFPVNEPELWAAYVPEGVTQYLRLFSEWGGTKLERMRDAGYDVVILDEGAEKQISGSDVRGAIRAGRDWSSLVPPGVARVIRSLERVAV